MTPQCPGECVVNAWRPLIPDAWNAFDLGTIRPNRTQPLHSRNRSDLLYRIPH